MFFGDVHKIVLSFTQRRSMKSTIITVDNKAMHSLQEIWFKAWFLNVVFNLPYLWVNPRNQKENCIYGVTEGIVISFSGGDLVLPRKRKWSC